jgi:hypothetical protein
LATVHDATGGCKASVVGPVVVPYDAR